MAIERPVGILGAGPVGSILAASLARAGQEVIIVESSPGRLRQLSDGLSVEGLKTLSTTGGYTLVDDLEKLGGRPLHALFVCTKAWSLAGLLPVLETALNPEALVISFQNGIGPEDEMARVFPPARVARGVVNYAGGLDPETGAARLVWFNPPNFLGAMAPQAAGAVEELAGLLTGAGLETRAVPWREVKEKVFLKTILNAALSPLCAATGITMRKAMTYPHTRAMARALLQEGLGVAAALGYHYGEDALDRCMGYLDRGGDHMPSMWVDLERGTRTEIDYINGKIVQIGGMFRHTRVDLNRFMAAAVVTREIRDGARDPGDIPDHLKSF